MASSPRKRRRARQRPPAAELQWEGKSDAARELPDDAAPAGEASDLELEQLIDPGRLALTLGAGSTPRREPLPLESRATEPTTLPNLLIEGDNLVAMRALCRTRAESIDLIYIDPPYATGLSYYSQHRVGPAGHRIERRAYRDGGRQRAYLDFMYPRLAWMHRLLTHEGKLFVHCDWRASSLLRLLLDEIFGPECFRNEIIWRRAPNLGRQAAARQLGRVIDSIHVYSKTPGAPFRGTIPRRRRQVPLNAKGKPKGARWDAERSCYFTTAPRGDYTDASITKLRQQGRVFDASSGKVYIKYYLTPGDAGRWYKEQPVDALWDDPAVRPLRHRSKAEVMGYDTQKPEGLLERIISWASAPGDWVADFFCGSGTTAAAAARLHRHWIACDVGSAAVSITKRRLIDLSANVQGTSDAAGQSFRRPFELRSVERTERRAWARALTRASGPPSRAEPIDTDAAVVLEALGAEPTRGRWGRLPDALAWVAAADVDVGTREIDAACASAVQAKAQSLVVLGWRWSAETPPRASSWAEERHGIRLCLRTVPRELRHGGRGRALQFSERPEIDVALRTDERADLWMVELRALRYPDPPAVRSGAQEQPRLWHDWVERWMVDFAGRPDCFQPTWQGARTPSGSALELCTPPQRIEACHAVRVEVLTVFGDTIHRLIELPAALLECGR